MYTGTLPPISNRATWDETVQCIDDESGEPIDISSATEIVAEVCSEDRRCLSASLSAGTLHLGGLGIFFFEFSADEMKSLCAQTYDFNCFVTIDGDRFQPVAALLPVMNGHHR